MQRNFICVCLSPAMDVTLTLPKMPGDGEVINAQHKVQTVGGKGINVVRYLAARGREQVQVTCVGYLGRENAMPFEQEFATLGIRDLMQRVDGPTRINTTFLTPEGSFKVNRQSFPGVDLPPISLDLALKLPLADIASAVASGLPSPKVGAGSDITVILTGSLPSQLPADTYAQLIYRAKALGALVVLDSSGEALRQGAAAHPHILKPNAHECAVLTGFEPHTPSDFARASAILREWCDYPIITDGARGAYFDGEYVPAPAVAAVDATAAGDTLLAEWCYSHSPTQAVQAAAQACLEPGCPLPKVTP